MGRRREQLPAGLVGRAFSTGRALELGVGESRLRGADLDRPFHGVRANGVDTAGLKERCRALATVMAPWQAFSHATAVRLREGPLPTEYSAEEPLHVISLEGRDAMRRDGVVGHTTGVSLTTDTVSGVRVVKAADMWCQLAEPGSGVSREWLVAIGDLLISGARGDFGRRAALCSRKDLDAALTRFGKKRGSAALAWARPRLRSPVDSVRETFLRLHIVAAGLPEPAVQLAVATSAGVRHADLGYREKRLLFEYLGDAHRTSRRRWLEDLTRVQLFEDAGYRVMLIGGDDLEPDPGPLTDRIRRALRA